MSLLINDPPEAEAIAMILSELVRSRKLHPFYTSDPLRRTAIMCEEAGEALKAAVDLTRDWAMNTTSMAPEAVIDKVRIDTQKMQDDLYLEVIQTGAMAVKLLVAMIEERDASRREKILS